METFYFMSSNVRIVRACKQSLFACTTVTEPICIYVYSNHCDSEIKLIHELIVTLKIII